MADSSLDPRTLISIDGETIVLAADQDIEDLQERIQQAVAHPEASARG